MMKSFAGLILAVATTTEAVKIQAEAEAEWGSWGYDDFANLPDWEEETIEVDPEYDWTKKTESYSADAYDWDNLPQEDYEDIFSAGSMADEMEKYDKELESADDIVEFNDIIEIATNGSADELDLGLELNAIIAAVDATCSSAKSCDCGGEDACKCDDGEHGDCGCGGDIYSAEKDCDCGCDEEKCDGGDCEEGEDCRCPIELAGKACDAAAGACACAEEAMECAEEACECADKAVEAVAEEESEDDADDEACEGEDCDGDAEDADDEEDEEEKSHEENYDEILEDYEDAENPWWMQFYGGW